MNGATEVEGKTEAGWYFEGRTKMVLPFLTVPIPSNYFY